MYQKDFILRMIEMMGEFIALLLGLIKKGDMQQAAKRLNNAYKEFLKKDAAFFQIIPKEELTTKLIEEHNYTNGHLKILSELFFAEGEVHRAKGDCRSGLEYYEKAIILFEFTEKDSNTFSLKSEERRKVLNERIDELQAKQQRDT